MDAAVILETVIAEESATDVTFNDGEKEAFMRVIQRPRGLPHAGVLAARESVN